MDSRVPARTLNWRLLTAIQILVMVLSMLIPAAILAEEPIPPTDPVTSEDPIAPAPSDLVEDTPESDVTLDLTAEPPTEPTLESTAAPIPEEEAQTERAIEASAVGASDLATGGSQEESSALNTDANLLRQSAPLVEPLASATANYISLDLVASDPFSYDHQTGGGAFDDRTIGTDVVESLEGGDFACGDQVSFLTEISLDGTQENPNDPRTLQLTYSFLLDTTGQSGLALGPITFVGINYGAVSGGDGAGGTDSGFNDDGGSTATLVSQTAPTVTSPPYFTSGETNDVVINVTDLEADETVILRIDAEINCDFGSNPTGNLQADLQSATVIAIGSSPANDTVPSGNQTVPFKAAGDVVFPAKIIVDKVTDPSGATQSFDFTVTAPGSVNSAPYSDSFSLTDAATPHDSGLIDPSTAQIGNRTVTFAGNYTVSEVNIPGAWDLDTIVCTSNLSVTPVYGATSATFALDENEIITCTFTNELQQGTLKVTKYNDLNADGDHDAGEPVLSGWEFFIDDGDGIWESGIDSPKQLTNADGEVIFSLNAGTYSVCEVLQGGWANSDPGTVTPCESATVVAGQETSKSFGNYQQGTTAGTKFEDENADGDQDAGDAPLSGWVIRAYVDLNGDGILQATETTIAASDTTDANGDYSLSLDPGTYVVCEVSQAGWTQSSPDNTKCDLVAGLEPGGYAITVTSGSSDVNLDFGNFEAVDQTVLKYHDLNADGDRDSGEPVLSGWEFFIDVNGNGVWNDGIDSPKQSTGALGTVTFAGLRPGAIYTICEVLTVGWLNSDPTGPTLCESTSMLTSGTTPSPLLFGNFQEVDETVLKYHDLNADGDRDTGEPVLAGWTFFIDLDGDEVLDLGEVSAVTNGSGIATFSDLTPGASYSICEVLTAGWFNSDPTGPTLCKSTGTLVSGTTPAQLLFGNSLVPVPTLLVDKVASTETITISGPNDALVATPSVVTWTLSYTLTNGPLTGVVISDPVPTGFTFLDATNGGTLVDGSVVWNLGNVSANGSVSFRTTVNPATISRIAPTTNVATIDSNETPPDTGQDSVTVVVSPPPLAGNPPPRPQPVLPNTAAGIGIDGTPITVPIELLVAFFIGSLGALTLASARTRSRRR